MKKPEAEPAEDQLKSLKGTRGNIFDSENESDVVSELINSLKEDTTELTYLHETWLILMSKSRVYSPCSSTAT